MNHLRRIGAYVTAFAAMAVSAFGGSTVALAANTSVVPDEVQRGGVIVVKRDGETGESKPQGGAELANAEFTITNENDHAIVYVDKLGTRTTVPAGGTFVIKTEEVTENGKTFFAAKTTDKALPFGTYHIQETASSYGYGLATLKTFKNHYYVPSYINDAMTKWADEGYDFTISKDGQMVTFDGADTPVKDNKDKSAEGDYSAGPACYNVLVRGGIEVVKRDHDLLAPAAQGNASLKGGTFAIYLSKDNPYPVRVWGHFDQSDLSVAPEHTSDIYSDDQAYFHGMIEENYSVTLRSGETVSTNIDKNGWAKPGDCVAIIQTGEDGRAQTFMDALPVGWYSIVEVEAPVGYVREAKWQANVEIETQDWDELVPTDCDDPVLRGGAQIQKFDAALDADGKYMFAAGEAQGNATLEGAHIEIYNNSTRDVYILPETYKTADGKTTYHTGDVSGISGIVAPGQKVAEIVTNEHGIATIKGLPYGSYYAVEVSPSHGYALNSDWRWDFDIKDESKCDAYGQNIAASANGPEKGAEPGDEAGLPQDVPSELAPVHIWKVDAETKKTVSLATKRPFNDIEFTVKNTSANAVNYNGKAIAPGELLSTEAFKTDEDGGLWFDVKWDEDEYLGHYHKLPVGTYEVVESKAPEGYVLDTTPHTVTVDFDDDPKEVKEYPFEFVDRVKRGDISFSKTDTTTNKQMVGVPFLLEKLDDEGNVMEWHILVTDENGVLDTAAIYNDRFEADGVTERINRADQWYDAATGEYTGYTPLIASKEALLSEIEDLMGQLDEKYAELGDLLKATDYEHLQSLYAELTEIMRKLNDIAFEQGDESEEYAATVKQMADKIAEIHDALDKAKAADPDFEAKIAELTAEIEDLQNQIAEKQEELAGVDSKLSGDDAIWHTGYWFFGGERQENQTVSKTAGALPYGKYRLTEIRCEANKGMELVSRDVFVTRDSFDVDLGTIDNMPPDDCKTPDDPCNEDDIHGTDVAVEKTSNPAPNSLVKPGNDITYTLNYENTSASKVPYFLLRDYVPKSTTFKSAANDGVYVKDGGYVEWVVKDLEPGAKGSVSFTVTVNKGANPIIHNQARFVTSNVEITAGGDNPMPNYTSNVVRHTTDGTETGPYLKGVKRVEPAAGTEVNIGDTLTYYVDITNLGDKDATNVSVTDNVPTYTSITSHATPETDYLDVDDISDGGYRVGEGMVAWNIGTIKPGETKTVSFSVKVGENVRYSVANQATFGYSIGKCEESLSNTTNIVTNPVKTAPELTITKSADRVEETVRGEIITYTLHVENNGRGNAVNVPVWDAIPEGTQYVMGSATNTVTFDDSHVYPTNLAKDFSEASDEAPYVHWVIPVLYNRGGSVDLTYQVRVRDDVEIGSVIPNRASVGGDAPLGEDVDKPDSTDDVTKPAVSNPVDLDVVDPVKDIEVVKTADPDESTPIAPGDEITYTITATNNGEHSAYGFGIRDAIPEHTTYVDGSIVVTGADGKTSTEIKDEARQQATENPDECGTVDADDSIVWVPEAQITVGNMNDADAEGIYKIVVPDESKYKIYSWGTIKKALTHLAPGESLEFEVTATDGYNLYWRATYLEDGRILLWKRVLVPNWIDSANYARVNGGYGNYDEKWKDVYAIFDELKPGETVTLTFTVKVDEDFEPNTDIDNVATYGDGVWSAPCFDLPNETNHVIHTGGQAELVATKTVDKTDARVGDILTYTITIANDGTARAKNVAVFDEFRKAHELKGLTYVVGSYNVSGGDAAVASQNLAAQLTPSSRSVAAKATELQPGDKLVLTFQCLVADANDGDVLTNKAKWAFDFEGTPSADLENETNEVSTLVGSPTVSLKKTSDPKSGSKVSVGDTITYTFTLTNDSAVATNDAAVFDMIPAHTTLVEGSLTGGLEVVRGEDVAVLDENGEPMVDENGEAVTEPGPILGVAAGGMHLESGETREFSFKVAVDPTLTEDVTITNVATGGFSADTPTKPLQVSSNPTVSEAVAPDTELRILVAADPAGGTDVNPGDVITYTITAMNESTTPAKDVCIFDYIPEGTTFVNGSTTGGLKYVENGLAGDQPAVIATGLTLGANESKTFTFQVKVNDTLKDRIVSDRATIGEFDGNPTAPLGIDSNEVLSNVVAPKPAISVTAASDPASGTQVKAGDIVSYTINVTETKGIPAEGVAAFVYVPANTTYVEGSADGMHEITNAAGTVIALAADGISLDGNATKTMGFQVEVGNVSADTEISCQPTAGIADDPTLPLEQVAATLTHSVIAPKPELRITETATPAPGTAVSEGDIIDYAFTVSNDSDAIARGAATFVRIPEHTTYVDGSANGLKEIVDEDGNVIALYADNLTLAAHRSRTFGFSVEVAESGDVIISSRATCGFAEAPTTDLNIDSNEVIHGAAQPDIRVTKTSDVDPSDVLEAGDVVTYTITVKNASTGADSNVVVYDAIPEGTTYVAGSLTAKGATEKSDENGAIAVRYGKVAGLTTKTISFKVTVNEGASGIENVASFGHGATLPTAPLDEKTNPVTTPVDVAQPQLRLTKTADVTGAVSVGDKITYSFTLTNEGAGKATGVAVFDRVPEHTKLVHGLLNMSLNGLKAAEDDSYVYADGIELAPGESRDFSFVVEVTEDGAIISNRATAGFASNPTTDLELDSNEVVNAAEAPNTGISITSSPANGATVVEGSDITYTVRLANSGRGTDHDVAAYMAIPEGTIFVDGSIKADGVEATSLSTDGSTTAVVAHIDTLPGNSNASFTFTVRVAGDAGATVDAKATMGHEASAPVAPLATESETITHILDKEPQLSIVKTQEPGNGAWVAGGDELTYHITVTNTGNTVARKVGVYDEAPENTKFVKGSLTTDRGETYVGTDGLLTNLAGDLMPGESVTMTFKVRINLGFVGTIYNRAMWVSPAADPRAEDLGTATADDASAEAAAPAATVVPSTRLLGVLGATVPIPEGSYSGQSNEVTAGGNGGGTTEPTPEPTPQPTPEPEPEPQPESTPQPSTPGDSGSNEVNAGVKAPECKLTKTVSPTGTVKAGTVVTYTLRLENSGDVNANGLYLRDIMPEGVTFKSGSIAADGLAATFENGSVVARGNLKPGDVATISFKATVGSSFSGDLVNVAEWGQAEDGEVPTEMLGSSKVTNTVDGEKKDGDSNEVNAFVNAPTIQVIKSSDPADGSIVKPGTKVSYTIEMTNIGRVNGNSLYVIDEMPEGFELDEASIACDNMTATYADGAIVVRGNLAPAGKATLTYSGTVSKDFVGEIKNQAKWGQAEDDKTPDKFIGDSNEDLIHVGTTEVELVKSCDHADGTYVSRGSKLTYTIEAENKGTLDVDMVVTDKVPEGTTFESFETVGGKGEITSDPDGTISFKPGNLKPGEKAAFKFTVVVDADAIGNIKNEATWKEIDGEENGISNSVINHVSDAKISVTKTNDAKDGIVSAGQTVAYSIHVTNSGTTRGLVRLTDVIPEGLTLDKDSVKVTTDSINEPVAPVADDDAAAEGQATGDDADAVDGAEVPADGEVIDGSDEVAATDGADEADSADAEGEKDIEVSVKDESIFGALGRAFTAFVNWVTGAESDEAGIEVDSTSIKGAFFVAPNQTVAITYTAKVADDAKVGDAITNKVDVEVEGGDPAHTEDKITVGEPKLEMVKTTDVEDGAKVKVGDVITYTMHVTNKGNIASGNVTMTDTIPANTSLVSGSAKIVRADGTETAVADPAKGKGFEIEVGKLAAGETSFDFIFQVKVESAGKISSVENTAHFTAVPDDEGKDPEKGDSNPTNVPVEPEQETKKGPKLSVTKVGVDANGKEVKSFEAGKVQNWKITVTNSGDEDASGVVVRDLPGAGLSIVSVSDESGKSLPIEVTGSASTNAAYLAKLAASAKALCNDDGSYALGVSSFKDGYLYGSAAEGVAGSEYATAIPSGTYQVTLANGYRGVVQVVVMDESGKVDSAKGTSATLGYSTSADSLSVTVPENGRLVIRCQKSSGSSWSDVTNAEKPFTFTPTGKVSVPEVSSEDYAARFTVDKVAAGKSVSFTVSTKAASDAASTVENKVEAWIGATPKDIVKASAKLTRSNYSEPAKKSDGSGSNGSGSNQNLPKTAASIAGLVAIIAGIGGVAYGVTKSRRKNEDAVEVKDAPKE